MDCSTPGFPVLHYLLEFAQIHVPSVGNAIWPSLPLPLSIPFAFNLSQHQGLFQWVSFSHQVLKHQSYQWILWLISFRIAWFDLLTVQRTLKSLLQHHNSKSSVLRWSAFFMVQLSHPYTTIGKTIALNILGPYFISKSQYGWVSIF